MTLLNQALVILILGVIILLSLLDRVFRFSKELELLERQTFCGTSVNGVEVNNNADKCEVMSSG